MKLEAITEQSNQYIWLHKNFKILHRKKIALTMSKDEPQTRTTAYFL